MKKIVHKLRSKPAHVRDQIAIFSALTVAGIVTFFWLASLSSDYASPETKSSFNESFSPFKIFGTNVKNALTRSKAELSSVNSSNSTQETSDGKTSVVVDSSGVVELGSQ